MHRIHLLKAFSAQSLLAILFGAVLAFVLVMPATASPTQTEAGDGPPPVQPALTGEQIESALESALHTINEIGRLILDFAELIKQDPLEGFLELLNYIAQKLGLLDGGDGVDGPLPIPGPGMANQSYPDEDLFQPIGWINHDNGLPGIYAGRKPYGTNLGMMIDGYFFTLFAPDSGLGPGGFLFYDVSDPYRPRLVKRVYEPEGRTAAFREPHAFGVARIAGRRYLAFQSTLGVEFWDFTDLNDLQRVGEIDLPGVNGGDYSNVSWQLTWQAPYVYVASSEQGVFIVDAADPAHPVLAERDGPNPVPVSELGGFRVGPIFTFGNQLLISSMENRDGMASLDISDPLNPRLLDRIPDLNQFYYASCFNGKQVAVSVRGADARMELYDLSDPESFQLLDDQLSVPGQLYCAFQDHYVFQGTEDRVHKIDIRDPTNPVDIGSGTLAGPLVRLVDHGQVSPLGNLVFVGNDHGTGSAFMPHQTTPDNSPPQVVTTAPRDGSLSVSTTTAIGISFSDVLDFSSVSADSVQVLDQNGLQVAGIYSLQNGIVNFTPATPLLPFHEYRIRVLQGGVKDIMGNAFVEQYVAAFTTGADDQYLDVAADFSDATMAAQPTDSQSVFDITLAESLPGVTYEWDLGDGTVIGPTTDAAVTHGFSQPGHYQVRVTIRWQGQVRQESFIKTIVPPVTAEPAVKSSTIAQSEQTLFVVNPDNNSVTAVAKNNHQVLWETQVGESPQSIAWDKQNTLWVAVRGEDRIVVLSTQGEVEASYQLAYGAAPFAVVYNPQRNSYLVTLSAADGLLELDPQGNELSRINLTDPRAIAMRGDGSEAFVSRFISPTQGGEIYRLNISAGLQLLETQRLPPDVTTVDSQDRARGLANYLFAVAINPSGSEIAVTGKKDNIFRGQFRDGQRLDHDKTVRAVLNRVNLNSGTIDEWDFDNRANARAIAYSPLGDYVFVALQGSNKVAVVDAFSGSQRVEIETPLAPQGLAIDGAAGELYVHSFMSRSLSVFDISGLLASRNFNVEALAQVPLVAQEQLPDTVLTGKQIFYNADDPRMSRESYFSCASCHVDGGHDGRVWDFTERGEGLRNTIPLTGRAGMGHGNVHWTANFDEIQDFEHDIRNGFGGTGFLSDEDFNRTNDPLGQPKAGLSAELDALAAYVSSLLSVAKSPYKTAEGNYRDAALRGQQLFNSLDCAECHSGADYTDQERHQLATLTAGSGQGMGQPLDQVGVETPTLLGLWDSAPYFHQGAAESLQAVLRHPGHGNAQSLSTGELTDLTTYLLSLDGRTPVQAARQQSYQLRNKAWGCLSVSENKAGASVVLQHCEHAQHWWVDEHQRIHLAGNGSLCVEHNGKALFWSNVALQACSDSARQQFEFSDSGHLHWQGSRLFVLDGFSLNENGKVGSWWRHGGANQQWLLD